MEQEKALKAHRARSSPRSGSSSQVERAAHEHAAAGRRSPRSTSRTRRCSRTRASSPRLEVERIRCSSATCRATARVQDTEAQIANLKCAGQAEQERVLNKQTVRHNELYAELRAQPHVAPDAARRRHGARALPRATASTRAAQRLQRPAATSASRSRTSSRRPSRRSTRYDTLLEEAGRGAHHRGDGRTRAW